MGYQNILIAETEFSTSHSSQDWIGSRFLFHSPDSKCYSLLMSYGSYRSAVKLITIRVKFCNGKSDLQVVGYMNLKT